MKFHINEHPSIWLFLISLVILATTIVINVLYKWQIYTIVAIVLAGVAVVVLGYAMIKDLSDFSRKKSQYLASHPEEKDDDDKDRD